MAFKTFEQPAEAAGQMKARQGGGSGETIAAVFKALFSFRGTATRLEYWLIVVVSTLFMIAIAKLAGIPLDKLGEHQWGMLLVPNLVVMWLGWAVTTRRLRDRGWSTELILSVLVGTPVAAMIALVFAPFLLIPIALVNLWTMIECMFFGSVDV